jgi:hypothetical protein
MDRALDEVFDASGELNVYKRFSTRSAPGSAAHAALARAVARRNL